MANGVKFWDAATVAKLKKLLAQGVQKSVIAERLGVTPGAITMQLRRLEKEEPDA